MPVDELITSHLRFADNIAGKFIKIRGLHNMEADDVKAAARLGLVIAAQTFQPERGLKFTTFAQYRIFGTIVDQHRTERFKKNTSQGTMTMVSEDAIPELPVRYRHRDPFLRKQLLIAIREAGLTRNEKRVLLYLLRDEPLFMLARKVGVADSRASQFKTGAFRKLRRFLVDSQGFEPRFTPSESGVLSS